MTNNHQRFVPDIPSVDGKLAWVVARIDQCAAALTRSVSVDEVWIEVSPSTAAELVAELGSHRVRYADQVIDTHVVCAAGALPMAICIVEELDDTTFLLSLETSDMTTSVATTGVLGFCYPTPQPCADVETRWVLQYVDGVDASTAAALTAAL